MSKEQGVLIHYVTVVVVVVVVVVAVVVVVVVVVVEVALRSSYTPSKYPQ